MVNIPFNGGEDVKFFASYLYWSLVSCYVFLELYQLSGSKRVGLTSARGDGLKRIYSRKFLTAIAEPKMLYEARLIKANSIRGLPQVSIANPATSGPAAIPNERFVKIKACATGTSFIPIPGRWKLTVRSIGKKHHATPFKVEIMRRSGRESVEIRSM